MSKFIVNHLLIVIIYFKSFSAINTSSTYRDRISDILNIGKPNSKSFLKRVNQIGLTLDELKELLCQVKLERKKK